MHIITYHNLEHFSSSLLHFSSTRSGGLSRGTYASLNLGLFTQDNPLHIQQNRSLFCSYLGIKQHQLISAFQTHGVEVKVLNSDFLQFDEEQKATALCGYDAMITNVPNLCLSVTTADCVPVLMFDPVKNAIAVVHSGWRGTLDAIVVKTILKMEEEYQTKASDLVVCVGPCIEKDVYEVGREVFEAFVAKEKNNASFFAPSNQAQKYYLDLKQMIVSQLKKMNVKNIEVSTHCTFKENDLFFSARKLGISSGRMLSGIMLKK